MKKILFSGILLFTILPTIQAQDFELFLPFSGLGIEAFRAENLDPTNTGYLPGMFWSSYFVTFGGYVPALRPNDEISLGLDASFRLGYSFSADEYKPLTIQIPIYAMARFGLNATAYSSSAFGGGIGAGVDIRHMRFLGMDRRATYVAPSIVLDLNMINRGVPIGFRLAVAPTEVEFLNRYTGDEPASSGGSAQHVDADFRSNRFFSATVKYYF